MRDMAEERGRAWKYHVSPYKAGCRLECHASKPPIVQKKTATLDPCGLCRYTDYIPPRNILGGASKRGTLFWLHQFVLYRVVSKRWIDRWTRCAHWRCSLRLRGLGFLLVSQTCLVKSQVKVPIIFRNKYLCQEPGAFPEHIPDDYDAARWWTNAYWWKRKIKSSRVHKGAFQ